jgi:hypothetical protein
MKSAYLVHDKRLPDILAAIQVMGSHVWDRRTLDDWKSYLGNKPQSASAWESLFNDHPEFFGWVDFDGKTFYFLRLRGAFERTVDPISLRELNAEEIATLKKNNQYWESKIARRTLPPSTLEALMKAAIELQVRAAALDDRKRWWIPLLTAALGFVGALVGSLAKSLFGD